MQKLLVMKRETEEELMKTIRKELKDSLFVVRGLSVLKPSLSGWEAWIIIDDQTENIAGFE